MGNLNDNMMKYWLVKVGNLFYAGGIGRDLPENRNAKSYEFTNYEDAAFILGFEESAKEIANTVGGIVIPKEKILEEVGKLQVIHDAYIKSNIDSEIEFLKELRLEELRNKYYYKGKEDGEKDK